jgi:hypothetical protein
MIENGRSPLQGTISAFASETEKDLRQNSNREHPEYKSPYSVTPAPTCSVVWSWEEGGGAPRVWSEKVATRKVVSLLFQSFPKLYSLRPP